MKKLQNILASLLCATILLGCQHTIPGINNSGASKKNIPADEQYIPPAQSKQQYEEQKPAEQPAPQGVIIAQSPIKVALLVPLTGSYKDLGQGMLNAAQLALFRIGDPSITILPIDTKDSTYGATQAATEAVAQGAKIILGPVFSSGAKAIAKIAAENNIPVVSFSNDKSLAGTGVFAIGSMPEQQVLRIVNFAVAKGIKDYITIVPSDTYGTAITKELQQIINAKQGISVLKNEVYQADSQGRVISLDGHIKAALDAATNGAVSPRAMLIPANSFTTSQILGALSKYNYDKSKVQLLGNEQWNAPALFSNPTLEGAWFTALPRERRKDFENKFKEIYSYEAPKLSSLAYDGIALAATIAKNSNGSGFSREALINPRGFVGVDGIFRLKENGLAERGFAIVSIKGGNPVVIDAAPTSFADFK